MIFNRRTEIVNFIITQLKEIDGDVSPFDPTYTFTQNLNNNAYRQLKFIDEVNDFPSMYLTAGTEFRNFNTENLTVAILPVIIRIYVYGEDDSQQAADDLVQDVEHVIYAISEHYDMGIMDITIANITQDEGLASPYGIAEVELSAVYKLEN